MRVMRAIICGALGASAISVASAFLRAGGVPIQLELILGTAFGVGPAAFAVGLAMHLAIGASFGVLYAWLFETVWKHGGAATGMILAFLHASMVGMAVGLTPQFHPLIPEQIADPGPYFANSGAVGVIAFFAIHMLYGAIVGGGYGHVAAERAWAPAAQLALRYRSGKSLAGLYSLVATCESRGINPFDQLADVLARVQGHPANAINELLPAAWAG